MPIPTDPVPLGGGISMFFVHEVSVEAYEGSGAYGPSYAAPVAVSCFLDDGVRLVRNVSGAEVASSSTVYADLSVADLFLPESRVSVNGRTATVISSSRRDSGPLGLPDHVEVHLT